MVPGHIQWRSYITHTTRIQLELKKERMMKRDTFISLSPFELLIHLFTSVVLSRASSARLLKFYTHAPECRLSSFFTITTTFSAALLDIFFLRMPITLCIRARRCLHQAHTIHPTLSLSLSFLVHSFIRIYSYLLAHSTYCIY